MPHFMIVLIPYNNLLKPFLDQKNVVFFVVFFEEHGAFNIAPKWCLKHI